MIHTEIFTIGHSNHDLSQFISLLVQHQIQALVDVRSIPNSRFVPQFNRKRFAEALAAAGIAYHYLGDRLGGRPQDPSVYRSGRLPKTWAEVGMEIDYDRVRQMDGYQEGLQMLLDLAARAHTAVMCAEEDPQQCHRKHLIVPSLPPERVVWHIRADGRLEQDNNT